MLRQTTQQFGLDPLGMVYSMTHNLGDEIQQIALQEFLAAQGRGVDFEVNRDTLRSPLHAVPRGGRLIIHGWLVHPRHAIVEHSPRIHELYSQKDSRNETYFFDVEYLDSLNMKILYISVHLAQHFLSEISQSAVLREHFLRHAPIGCRDLATLKGLESLQIPCYFSACLTLQFSRSFSNLSQAPLADGYQEAETLVVDLPSMLGENNAVHLTNKLENSFEYTLENIENRREIARGMLRRLFAAKRVLSNRLHIFLPCQARGIPIEFVPANIIEPDRLDGLLDLTITKRQELCLMQEMKMIEFLGS